MTDYSRDRPDDEDRLPWLEPVEEEFDEGGVSTGRLVLWLTAALIVIALIVGAFLWLRSSDKAASGDGALIKAPDSYYKERADEQAPVDEFVVPGGHVPAILQEHQRKLGTALIWINELRWLLCSGS